MTFGVTFATVAWYAERFKKNRKKKEIKKRLRQLKDSPPHIRAHEIGRLKRRYEQLTQHWATLNPQDRQNEINAFRALSFPEREKYFKSVIQNKKGQ